MKVNENVFAVVVGFLGVTLLVCVGGIIWLSATEHSIPDILQNVASGIVAGLIGLLVSPKQAQNA